MVRMPIIPVRHKTPYGAYCSLIRNISRQDTALLFCDHVTVAEGCRWFCSTSIDSAVGWPLQNEKMVGLSAARSNICAEAHVRCILKNEMQRRSTCVGCHASRGSTNESQLRALDSYFCKLRDDSADSYLDNSNNKIEAPGRSDAVKSKKGLDLLDAYLGKLNGDTKSEENRLTQEKFAARNDLLDAPPSPKEESKGVWRKQKSHDKSKNGSDESGVGQSSQLLQQFDEISDLYLIGIIASINIAVFLFEIASPVRNSDLDLFSLPLLYGAKINHLILTGEWWRLVTPMFLHSGILHVGLGCWALLTFGPKVCKGYGGFTFLLIYLLGGISGNLTSFLHTPDPTVGGTGPIFAMIGAWLIYHIQNKDVISKDVSDSMFQKAVLTTALSFLLSNFGPIDDWTHFGAAITGGVFGYFTCPTLQMDDASSTSGHEEGLTLVRKPADPCKSLLVFTLSILVLGSLIFFVEPPLGTFVADSFL